MITSSNPLKDIYGSNLRTDHEGTRKKNVIFFIFLLFRATGNEGNNRVDFNFMFVSNFNGR